MKRCGQGCTETAGLALLGERGRATIERWKAEWEAEGVAFDAAAPTEVSGYRPRPKATWKSLGGG